MLESIEGGKASAFGMVIAIWFMDVVACGGLCYSVVTAATQAAKMTGSGVSNENETDHSGNA